MEIRKTNSIIEYARNPRKNDHVVDKIASAINEFGFKVPLIIKADGSLIDGHLRLKAANKLGLQEVPCIVADDLNEAQIKAFRLSVNKMAEGAYWDNDLLKLELEELKEFDFDISGLGFDDGELASIFLEKIEGQDDPDKEWEGMPEFDQPDKTSFRHVVVHFESEIFAAEFFRVIGQEDTGKTKSIWFPPQDNMDTESKRYGE